MVKVSREPKHDSGLGRKLLCYCLAALVLIKVFWVADNNNNKKRAFDHDAMVREALGGRVERKRGFVGGGRRGRFQGRFGGGMMMGFPGGGRQQMQQPGQMPPLQQQRPGQQPRPPFVNGPGPGGPQQQSSYGEGGALPKDYDKVPPYIKENCDLRGIDYWMVPEGDWRRQIAFLILGEKKSGTTGLFKTLTSHPEVIPGRTKELIFFNPKKFRHWEGDKIGGRVRVASARAHLFSQFQVNELRANSSLISGEGTPEYLLYPDICDKAILCTIPWVKTIAIIREPVDRLFSHYNFLKDPSKHNATMAPFETFIKRDVMQLQEYGVLPMDFNDIPKHMGSKAEADALHAYQYMFRGERQFIRSLYALQLEGWARSLERVGKDPKDDLRVVISAQVKADPQVTRNLLDWLGVSSLPHKVTEAMITKYTSVPIDPALKEWINKIVAPYNKRLYKFLGKEYDGVFDKN